MSHSNHKATVAMKQGALTHPAVRLQWVTVSCSCQISQLWLPSQDKEHQLSKVLTRGRWLEECKRSMQPSQSASFVPKRSLWRVTSFTMSQKSDSVSLILHWCFVVSCLARLWLGKGWMKKYQACPNNHRTKTCSNVLRNGKFALARMSQSFKDARAHIKSHHAQRCRVV